ncbi:hypothetical protein [Parabacteroides sp. FAFU027]|uniref:hypothetical protein n=1 Tax=Parabacteroides sp. FAFU027 TaxID=2922715 RepID=UPI001FB03AF8|nr:hypothetical protein [Parabacteroides sp. FAFU027]
MKNEKNESGKAPVTGAWEGRQPIKTTKRGKKGLNHPALIQTLSGFVEQITEVFG